MQAAIRATANLEVVEGGVEDLIVEHGRVCGVVTGGRPPPQRRRRGADHRHLPQRPHPPRRAADPCRPLRRSPRSQALRTAVWVGAATRSPQDRHPGPPVDGFASTGTAWSSSRRDDPPVPFSFLTDGSPRRRSPAPSPARPRRRTPSSAPISPARPCIPGRSPRPARATARRSRTRSCASPTAKRTRFSSSRRASTTTPSIRTASRPLCRPRCRRPSSAPCRGWKRR